MVILPHTQWGIRNVFSTQEKATTDERARIRYLVWCAKCARLARSSVLDGFRKSRYYVT